MENVNTSLVISLVVGTASLLAYIYCIRRQFYEVLLPKDWLTNLRWIILLTLLVAILGAIPSLVYTGIRVAGEENQMLRNIATVTGNVSRLAGATLLVLIYTYRRRDG